MPLQTTVIGSYPKPPYLQFLPDWFNRTANFKHSDYIQAVESHQNDLEQLVARATKEVIDEQTDVGIDIVTNGEIIRENYVSHLCHFIEGIDVRNTTKASMRNGACVYDVPVIRGKLSQEEPVSHKEWKQAQDVSSRPVKFTLPGPMTIVGSTYNGATDLYKCDREICEDLVPILNQEILALANAGCKHIQIDEPVFVRKPEEAMEYGIENLTRCFKGVGSYVTKVVHLCCGYPEYLDQKDYLKADKGVYLRLAEKLDNAGVDQISLEDAHRYNDLELFAKFKKKTLIIGIVKIASSKIESEQEISSRVAEILRYVPEERLILAPDCGLAYLADNNMRLTKLRNMVAAAKSF